jgi:DNA-binding CsgD family transcriptional regulator
MSELAKTSELDRTSPGGELWSFVGDLPLPLYLIDLSTYKIINATGDLMAIIERPVEDVIGHQVFDLYNPREHKNIDTALSSLAKGSIDFFRSRRILAYPSTGTHGVTVWVKVLEFGDQKVGLAEVCNRYDAVESPLLQYLGFTPQKIAAGFTDAKGIVTAVSNDVESLVGIPAARLVGHHLLNDADQRRWEEMYASPPVMGGYSISHTLEREEVNGVAIRTRCILTSFANSSVRCFILIGEPKNLVKNANARIAELEQRLWRIAGEVQASGVFDPVKSIPDLTKFDQMGSLSGREWEVLTRLLSGERVASIARVLFVSQSTIRNNLSSIFRKFGVHSQAELLTLLAHPKEESVR